MSLISQDEAFKQALKKRSSQRTPEDLQIIYSNLHCFEALSSWREQNLRAICSKVRYEWHDANEILYGKDDPCDCWFILLSGSIYIQGSMFLRNTCFGKQIPGSKKRGCQCLVLEESEMIAIDYPDMPPLHTGSVRNMRNLSSSSKSTLDSVAEVDSSSVESSPKQGLSRNSSAKMANGRVSSIRSDTNSDNIKDAQEYFINQDDNTSQDDPEQDDQQSDLEEEEEQEDSISLHSSSSFVIKDYVTDVLRKEVSERNEDDNDVLLEFTRSLQAFSNMTEPIRRELCKVMVFALVEKAGTELLKDGEVLDSWSVIINGQVQIMYPDTDEAALLYMGESFGVTPSMQQQHHKGFMYTMTDDCQFLCIAQEDYCNVLHQGKENMQNVMGEDGALQMVKEKREIEGGKHGQIVIRGTPESLRSHLLEENSIDTTYAEDYLLTYRAFSNEPLKICSQLLEWFERDEFKAKVTRVILLWVNNHFNDFECDRHMMELLEKFEEKLQSCNKTGECRLFNIACTSKAKPRVITLTRQSNEEDLGFSITGGTDGYPIYILKVSPDSNAEKCGIKRGDQLLNVNGQNFEKLNMERANTILRKNTDLSLTVKTNLFAFKEMMADIKNPSKKKDKNKKGKGDRGPVISQITTMQPTKPSRMPSITADVDMFDGKSRKEVPEDVIKVFRADQTYKFVFVNQDTTAEEAVRAACKEFGIASENSKNYSLCRVTVQNETFVKQSKLPDKLSNLTEIPLTARYYLKNNMESEQLLPDENIQDLLKEANYTFLDLNCFEVALHLTLQDYELFKTVEQTDFIDDLFHLNEANLSSFKAFEDLVNRELFWVVSTICLEPNALRRSKIIKHFTKIAHHCKAMKNLNSTFAIISGLGYRAVSRMKASWEKVPAKVQRTFEDLQSLMDPSRNMSKYRTLLNELTSQPPVLPYIPVVKKDLTFLHLGNDTKVDDLVNFEKMRMIGREVRNVCRLCSADSSQIISCAMAQNHEADKPSSNIYHTLTRKGRRSSFNNARKMYEDAMNARRVKQYMQQLEIEKDEDKLIEMSKQVEPASVSSGQTKRRNIAASDSPSRSSKTLPGGHNPTSANSIKRLSTGRHGSEPQISVVPGMLSTQNVRKKNPVSSFPKFGTSSPQAIRKLLALSEDGDAGSSGSSKRGSLEQRRSGSTSSRELSPATSPYLSSRSELGRSKGSISSSDSGQSIAQENMNRNNNKGRYPNERPIIIQGRSGSSGALSVTTVKSDRKLPPGIQDRKLSGSSSSPSLSARAAASHHHLILPNRQQIPRSPSMDSGVVSIGSLSADSTKFLNTDAGEIFHRPSHRSNVSLTSSEGFVSQQSLHHIQEGTASSNSQSPVMRRHLRNLHMKQQSEVARTSPRTMETGEATTAKQKNTTGPGATPPRVPQTETEDDIKQTFLSGSRGWGDAPLMRDKDPWSVEAVMSAGVLMTPPGWSPHSSMDTVAPIGESQHGIPYNQHGKMPSPAYSAPMQRSREFKGGGDVVDGPMQYIPSKRTVSGSGADIQLYYERLKLQERPKPPQSLNFNPGLPRNYNVKTPEAILEEKLILELQQQKPRLNKSFDSAAGSMYYQSRNNRSQVPLCERQSASFSGIPPGYRNTPGTPVSSNMPMIHQLSLDSADHSRHNLTNMTPEYPNYPNVCTKPGCKCPSSRQMTERPNHKGVPHRLQFNPAGRTSSPKQNYPLVDQRGRIIAHTDHDYVSNYGNPDSRNIVRAQPEHFYAYSNPNIEREGGPDCVPLQYHCPKHGNPYVNPHKGIHYQQQNLQAFQGVPEFSSLPLPPPLSSTPDPQESHYGVDPRYAAYRYQNSNPVNHGQDKHVISHTRSASDLSLHSSSFEYPDSAQYGSADDLGNVGRGDRFADNSHMSPGKYSDVPHDHHGRYSLGNISANSTPKSHVPPSQPVRRKSSEWAVTDLDKENNQQAMQVWTSGSSSTLNASSNTSKSSLSTPSQDQSPAESQSVNRRKKPPPLPPQRNMSYGITRQVRLSSSTLSPLSSPPNSPTTPISHTRISLSDTHPQLVVKTMTNGSSVTSSEAPPRTKPLLQSNGAIPQTTQTPVSRKDISNQSVQSSTTPARTLPSYSQALNHISQLNTSLPSYQNYQDMRDNKEQTSQV